VDLWVLDDFEDLDDFACTAFEVPKQKVADKAKTVNGESGAGIERRSK
jgi:hypothetical protein